MKEDGLNVNQRIAKRVRELRGAQGMSLEALGQKSGVSRSMLSLVERGESSPTAVLLEKVAAGLGVTLGSLFDAPAAARQKPSPVARHDEQVRWKDPASGYVRRNVSPPGVRQAMQIVEVRFPARARVTFEAAGRDTHLHQQVWMLEGTMEITVGEERHRLQAGDCLATEHDLPKVFYNPTRKAARYAVVIGPGTTAKR